jgi:hypothetical protein
LLALPDQPLATALYLVERHQAIVSRRVPVFCSPLRSPGVGRLQLTDGSQPTQEDHALLAKKGRWPNPDVRAHWFDSRRQSRAIHSGNRKARVRITSLPFSPWGPFANLSRTFGATTSGLPVAVFLALRETGPILDSGRNSRLCAAKRSFRRLPLVDRLAAGWMSAPPIGRGKIHDISDL